ncbi:hypothetical protein N7454_008999 [Penicillium verhagenii]|nr:hypothetical protein N7454_008999 [Penicillium verhagenii]
MYPSQVLRMQPLAGSLQPGARKLITPPSGSYDRVSASTNSCLQKEAHSAHTISQRLRMIKKCPPELIPLGIVLGVAVGAAIYASTKKLMSDKTLRLYRNSPESREH